MKLVFQMCAFFFYKDHMNMSFYGNQIRYIRANFTAKNVLLTFQNDKNGTFLENVKYHYWILHTQNCLRGNFGL